ncbi:MAG: hypothetical protein NDI60_10185, partial [Elusimicrobiales bacterium]|nr:hypothetical protein [Elusimicrobiales bacterium]
MKTIFNIAAAAFLALGAVPNSAAAALEDLGAPQAVAVPEVGQAAVTAEAQQLSEIDLFSYFGYAQTPRAEELAPVKGLNDVILSVDLEGIRNAYLRPAITFTTGAGTKVFVSGTKASNCPNGGNSCDDKDKFFLVLTTDKNQSFFVRAMEIINAGIFASGSKTVTIDGERYVVKVYAKISAPENSRLEIKGPRGVALNSTLKEIGDAVAAKGVD